MWVGHDLNTVDLPELGEDITQFGFIDTWSYSRNEEVGSWVFGSFWSGVLVKSTMF